MNLNLVKLINSVVIGNLFLINVTFCFENKANEECALCQDVSRVKLGDTEMKLLAVRFKRAVQTDRGTARSATAEDIDRKVSINQSFPAVNGTDEPCIGSPEFCNLTKEEYVRMLQEYIYPQTYEWVLIGTHSAVFVIGLVGNALVCIAVYRNHTMRTVTNYFIVNLAVADFMVILFCLPATVLWDVTETWFLGDVLCKILLYFQVSFPIIIFNYKCYY